MKKAQKARRAFESLKAQGLPASKSSVARLSGVSRSLLSPTVDDRYKTDEWKQLAIDIDIYSSSEKNTKTTTRYRNKLQELRKMRDEMERKYHAQVEQTAGLYAEMVMFRQELINYKSAFDKVVEEKDNLQGQFLSLSDQLNRPDHSAKGNITPLMTSIVISPDEELMRVSHGEYKRDCLSLAQAHTISRTKLKQALTRPIPKRLYILIGRPGSGKSSWIKIDHTVGDRRLAIYYDATNGMITDRRVIKDMARKAHDTVVCYVYFDIDVMKCIHNSSKRTDKIIPDSIIRDFKIEPPELFEGFDELIIVRELGSVL